MNPNFEKRLDRVERALTGERLAIVWSDNEYQDEQARRQYADFQGKLLLVTWLREPAPDGPLNKYQ